MSFPEFPSLPLLDSCDGCSACCLEIGAPPDYIALLKNSPLADDPSFAEDSARLSQLPDEAARRITRYLSEPVAGGRTPDGPCVWLDADRKRCEFYDWRPSSCRVLESGSPGCRIYRRRQGVDATAERSG